MVLAGAITIAVFSIAGAVWSWCTIDVLDRCCRRKKWLHWRENLVYDPCASAEQTVTARAASM